ncbi:MAG: 50S ribosomal protein L25 [Vulcanimicrobiaceae bacterium]
MPTKDLTLSIEAREGAGSTRSSALRHAGKVPAVLYGHGSAPQAVALDARAFDDLLHRGAGTALVTLLMAGKKTDTVLVREVQRDPLTRKVIHADLQRVSANEEVHTRLPVVTIGVPIGVKEFGGVLDIVLHELEIAGPANRIPPNLEVDVSELGLHEHITASQVTLPDGFKMFTPPEAVVVAVESSKTALQLEETPTLEQAEPEVVGETPPPEGGEPSS